LRYWLYDRRRRKQVPVNNAAQRWNMSVLVTGGAGYIGGHMALALTDAGEKTIVVDNLSTGFAWAVPQGATLAVGTDRAADRRA
jgi:nucleoside-diphosphate-sugar epimerase